MATVTHTNEKKVHDVGRWWTLCRAADRECPPKMGTLVSELCTESAGKAEDEGRRKSEWTSVSEIAQHLARSCNEVKLEKPSTIKFVGHSLIRQVSLGLCGSELQAASGAATHWQSITPSDQIIVAASWMTSG